MQSLNSTKLADFVDKILPDCLDVQKDGELLLDFDGKIIFERCSDMSDDEQSVYTNRLAKSLAQLSLKSFSTLMLQVDLIKK